MLEAGRYSTFRSMLMLVCWGLGWTMQTAWAEETLRSPEFIRGATLVTSEELIELAGQAPELVLIDARITGDRKQGFIEGSISLPNIETTCASLETIVADKSVPSVYYCNGVKCGRSAESVRLALGCGYQHVYWFRGGFEEWKAKGYPYIVK